MLYLYTGVPGSGKTLSVVAKLAKNKDFRDRPLYVDGIPDLDNDKIPHLPIPDGETVQSWPDWAPPGAIIVVDECQRHFRPRPRACSQLLVIILNKKKSRCKRKVLTQP